MTWPVGVKPNFSKRIMARLSLEIVRVLISAVARVNRERKRNRRRKGGFVILGEIADGGGRSMEDKCGGGWWGEMMKDSGRLLV